MFYQMLAIVYLVIALLCWAGSVFSLLRLRFFVAGNIGVLLFLMGLWSALSAVDFLTTSVATQLVITRFAYIAYTMVTPCWVLFLVEYSTRKPQLKNPKMIALFALFAGIYVLQWFNPGRIFYRNIRTVFAPQRTYFLADYGPAFWAFTGISYLLLLAAGIWLAVQARRKRVRLRHLLLMLAATYLPTLCNLPYVFRLVAFDCTPLGFAGSCVLLAILYRQEFFAELPPSRRAILDTMEGGIILLDSRGHTVWCNRTAQDMLALSPRADACASTDALLAKWFPEGIPAEIHQQQSFTHPLKGVLRFRATRTPLRGTKLAAGHSSLLILQDETALYQAQQRLHRLQHFDEITGIYNRHYFTQLLDNAIANCLRREQSLSVICATIINQKDYCNLYGTDFCDALLHDVGQKIQKGLRSSDVVARFPDDEFYLLFTFSNNPEEVQTHTEGAFRRIAGLFNAPLRVGDTTVQIRLRAGAAFCPFHARQPDTLLTMARSAKRSADIRHNQLLNVYDHHMGIAFEQYVKLEQDLYHALSQGEFFLVYQPQVHISTRRVVGVEALLRWRHPELGIISPNTFIPIAEESGLLHDIGLWVIEQAVAQLRIWHDMGLKDLRVGANVSMSQLIHPDFSDRVLQIIQEADVPPENLELELTESIAMFPEALVHQHLPRLHEAGLRLAMDDFGMGHSSLSYLKHFSLDTVKLDKVISSDILQSDTSLAVVRSVQQLCDSIGLDTVVEYIEQPEQLPVLEELGCNVVQGYVFSPPLPEPECTSFLLRSNGLEAQPATSEQA